MLFAAAVGILTCSSEAQAVMLRALGSTLVLDRPVHPAEVVVVALAGDRAGVLEAADLIAAGMASRVAVIGDAPDAIAAELNRRGAPLFDDADRALEQLRALGVHDIEGIPIYAEGTEDEGPALADWSTKKNIRSMIVVTSLDHSRRLARVLSRSVDPDVTVYVRGSRYSVFQADRWWKSHPATRLAIIELQKLLLDVLRHPLS
jgi:hypothetical protein